MLKTVIICITIITGMAYAPSFGADTSSNGSSASGNGEIAATGSSPEAGKGENQDRVTIKGSAAFAIPGFELRDYKYADRSIHYLRDQVLYAGAMIYYRGAGLGGRAGVMDAKKPYRRKVDDFEVMASYFSRSFGIELNYQWSGRYYIARSPYGTGRLWNNANQGSRMKDESAGVKLFLFMKDLLSLNKDYSYGSVYQQSGRQSKSCGTFLILAGADYDRLRTPAAIVPGYNQFLLMGLKLYGMTGWRFIGFSIGVGFAYALALPGNFYLAPLIALAVHPSQMEFFTPSGVKKDFRIHSMKGYGRITAGYDGERFFAGLFLLYESILYPAVRYKTVVWNMNLNAGIFTGTRI
jgi:hypothetical protein